jgi:lipopolysaccharide biosynthesis protein
MNLGAVKTVDHLRLDQIMKDASVMHLYMVAALMEYKKLKDSTLKDVDQYPNL